MAIIKPNNNTISAITALPAAIDVGALVHIKTINASSVSSVDFVHGTNDAEHAFTLYKQLSGKSNKKSNQKQINKPKKDFKNKPKKES